VLAFHRHVVPAVGAGKTAGGRESHRPAHAVQSLALAKLRSRGVLVCDAAPAELAASVVNRYLTVKRRGLL